MTTNCDLLVTGAAGQLGRAVLASAQRRGLAARGVDVDEMPLEDREAVQRTVREVRPGFVLHCGAITKTFGLTVLI